MMSGHVTDREQPWDCMGGERGKRRYRQLLMAEKRAKKTPFSQGNENGVERVDSLIIYADIKPSSSSFHNSDRFRSELKCWLLYLFSIILCHLCCHALPSISVSKRRWTVTHYIDAMRNYFPGG